MPLTPRQKNQIYEIYEVSRASNLVTESGEGMQDIPGLYDVQFGVKQQLDMAMIAIDADEDMSARVGEILSEYDNWALDYSTIDRNGYSFRPERNLRRVRETLRAYTGIVFQPGGSNRIRLG